MTKQDSSSPIVPNPEPPTTPGSEPATQGWGSALEKFIAALTDPDAEAKVNKRCDLVNTTVFAITLEINRHVLI